MIPSTSQFATKLHFKEIESYKSEIQQIVNLRIQDRLDEVQESISKLPDIPANFIQNIFDSKINDEIENEISRAINKEKEFKSVTRGVDDLSNIDGKKKDEKENKEDKSADPLINLLKEKLKDKVKDVRTSSRLTDSPACLVSDESAMDPQLEKILQQLNQLQQAASLKILEINPNHNIWKNINSTIEVVNKKQINYFVPNEFGPVYGLYFGSDHQLNLFDSFENKNHKNK